MGVPLATPVQPYFGVYGLILRQHDRLVVVFQPRNFYKFLSAIGSLRIGWVPFFAGDVIVEGIWELDWLGHAFHLFIAAINLSPTGMIFLVALYFPLEISGAFARIVSERHES
jgi:hypothetical protein